MASLAIAPAEPDPFASSIDTLSRRCAQRLLDRGVDCGPMLRAHGIDISAPFDPRVRISACKEEALLRDAEQAADDPYLGWSLGRFELRDLGVYGYTALNAPNVRGALLTLVELMPLFTENARFVLLEADREATLAQVLSTGRCTDLVSVHLMLCHLRELVGPDFEALRMGLPETDPRSLAFLSDLAGGPVGPGDVNFVTFPASLLDRPVHGADAMLADTLRRLWDEEKGKLVARRRAMRHLQGAIVPLLPAGEPKLDAVAMRLGIGTRTLKRELDELGLDLRLVTDLVRSQLVEGLLAEPGMTPIRVARALGLPDVPALVRAHERWCGAPPAFARGDAGAAEPS